VKWEREDNTNMTSEREKVEKYWAWREGRLSDKEAREFFDDEWEDVQKMADVQDILAHQPEPALDDDLFL